jgi:tetratricopeptide (TPR) repeat protein
MPTQTFATRTRLTRAALALLLLSLAALAPARASAQSLSQNDPDRQTAFELFQNQKFVDSLPLLERLAAKYPEDGPVVGRYGIALFVTTQSLTDSAQRKQRLARARAALVRGKELGLGPGLPADLVDNMIASLQPDGSESNPQKFSENAEADAAMREGEAAFAREDYDAALRSYGRALQLDPKLYDAALFSGDAHLQRGEFDQARQDYARAAAINPERETAYRYSGNSFMRQARLDEARDRYVEAVIAEPYNSYVWRNGLARWADAKGVHLGHPKIEPMSSVSPLKDNQTTITIDPKAGGKDDGTSAWMMYGIARAAWTVNNNERFRKQYPSEKVYRHSLAEEADALHRVVEGVRQQTKDGKIKQLDPALAELVRLDDAGLLEAYVLFARADEGIAQDYAAYRKTGRDKLRRYLVEYVASGRY